MAIADDIDERHQDVEPGVQGRVVAAEPFHDVRTLLRNDDGGLRHDEQHDERNQNEYNHGAFHVTPGEGRA